VSRIFERRTGARTDEAQIDMITPPTAFPICTIANTPRLPEHCIEWASVLEWPKIFKGA
jgi:ubiquitin-activating enzyme E1 C